MVNKDILKIKISSLMVDEGEYQAVALESPSQSPTESHDSLVEDNKCVGGLGESSSSPSEDGLDVRLAVDDKKV